MAADGWTKPGGWFGDEDGGPTGLDAYEAIRFLERTGVVSAPGFFWYSGSGESLLQAIQRALNNEITEEFKDGLRQGITK